ncbi:MAG TPA: DUF5684 domain-containing protein [bacterium]|nr:DUF5684 domain-containing protein [bacterium]
METETAEIESFDNYISSTSYDDSFSSFDEFSEATAGTESASEFNAGNLLPDTSTIGMPVLIASGVIAALLIVSFWKIFTKAGKPGWGSIIPIYSSIVLLQIIQKPIWWIVLLMIPFVNFAIGIIMSIELAKYFGKSAIWGFVMLFIFGIIGYPVLAFGGATYAGTDNATPPTPTPPSTPPSNFNASLPPATPSAPVNPITPTTAPDVPDSESIVPLADQTPLDNIVAPAAPSASYAPAMPTEPTSAGLASVPPATPLADQPSTPTRLRVPELPVDQAVAPETPAVVGPPTGMAMPNQPSAPSTNTPAYPVSPANQPAQPETPMQQPPQV